MTKANEAKEKTEIANEKEIVSLSTINAMGRNGNIEESDLKRELDSYIGDSKLTTVNTCDEGIVVYFTDSERSYLVDENGEIKNLIIKWKYDKNGNITDGTNTLKIGDYVNYNPTNYEGYNESTAIITSTEEQSGWADDQVFKLSSYKYGWRVLGLNELTGSIQLIAEDYIGPDTGGEEGDGRTRYLLRGQTGVTNGVKELNRISAFYGKGKYATGARTIKVEDINRITGYDPNAEKYKEGTMLEYGLKVTFYWQGTDYPYYSSANGNGTLNKNCAEGFFYYNAINGWKKLNKSTTASKSNMEKIATITISSYEYKGSSYMDISDIKYKILFKDSSNSAIQDDYKNSNEHCGYWLGDNAEWTNDDFSFIGYGIRVLYDDYIWSQAIFSISGWDAYDWQISTYGAAGLGIRPIVNLQSDIKIKDSDSDGIWELSE